MYLVNFYKCVFLTAGTSNTTSDKDVDPDVYSPTAEKLRESSFFERHFKEKSIKDMESNQKLDNSCISFESKDSLPSVDLETSSTKEKLSQDTEESLEFGNLPERPDCEDSKTMESPLVNFYYVCYIKNFIGNIRKFILTQYILKYYLLKLECATIYNHEVVEV